MKSSTRRLWKVSIDMKYLLILSVLVVIFSLFTQCHCDIQPIDVEAVKREQPDFEDDTGVGLPNSGAKDSGPKDGTDDAKAGVLPSISPSSKSGEESVDVSFMHAFLASLSIIIVSELGDKTFFISAIMAMSHPRLTVFAGAMTALAGMHIMSALFGYVITIIPRMYTFYASTALFAIFGIKMLREGYGMSSDEGKEELEEVQSDLRKREDSYEREPLEEGGGGGLRRGSRNRILGLVSRVFVQAFTLNVLAEWGDRSQIATVLMAAREDINGVIVGGLIGHFVCTGLAVLGGRMIASWISVKQVTIIGGVVFLIFAVSALIIGP